MTFTKDTEKVQHILTEMYSTTSMELTINNSFSQATNFLSSCYKQHQHAAPAVLNVQLQKYPSTYLPLFSSYFPEKHELASYPSVYFLHLLAAAIRHVASCATKLAFFRTDFVDTSEQIFTKL